jgi:hypothetical protein
VGRHRFPAVGVGRHADHRQARDLYGKGPVLTGVLVVFALGGAINAGGYTAAFVFSAAAAAVATGTALLVPKRADEASRAG